MTRRTAPHDVLQGTLTLLVLRSLARLGPAHGYAIAAYIERTSGHLLRVEQGSLYPALRRMSGAGWLRAEDGRTETKRAATFYALTAAGYEQLHTEVRRWTRLRDGVSRLLRGG